MFRNTSNRINEEMLKSQTPRDDSVLRYESLRCVPQRLREGTWIHSSGWRRVLRRSRGHLSTKMKTEVTL